MLTRIEIDGFKSFADFGLDIPPFLAIVGPNAAGKSNLFDAIQMLRRLADDTTRGAFTAARGEMGELFRRVGAGGKTVSHMRFCVEVCLEPQVVDLFGRSVKVNHTRLRYEVRLTQRPDRNGLPRPYVTHERVIPIKRADDRWAAQLDPSSQFRSARLRYGRSIAKLLDTVRGTDGRPTFQLTTAHGGRKRDIPADAAESTVLSSITTAEEFPLLFALRRELESWRFLHLDPGALRQPAHVAQPADQLEPSGANLALVLRRIEQRTADDTGSYLDEISADLSRLVSGVRGISVTEDPARQQWEVYLSTRGQGRISARVASDGTLRVLALLTALHDPDARGLICVEEPENGISPQRMREVLRYLRRYVADPRDDRPDPGPMTQLILSSHSPLILAHVPAREVAVFDWVTRVGRNTEPSGITRVRYLRDAGDQEHAGDQGRGPAPLNEVGHYVSAAERSAMVGIARNEAEGMLA
jgi:predicted ATPase